MAATSVIGSSISKIIKSSSFVLNDYPYTLSVIAVASQGTTRIHAYPFIDSAGFGTKYANPATLPGSTGLGVAFNPAGDTIAVASGGTPFVTAYPWSAGFGTKYANPATLPPSTGRGVDFNF